MDARLGAFSGCALEDLKVGQGAALEHRVTADDVRAFARLSGDTNPLHLDAAFAATTMFGKPVVHGLLTASFISAVLGTRLPGPGAVYLSQSLKFRAPVMVGDVVRTEVRVRDIVPDRERVTFDTIVRVGDTVVLEGEAVLKVPARRTPTAPDPDIRPGSRWKTRKIQEN
jgi:3-hydroxybutyryl-CoA dehydratase